MDSVSLTWIDLAIIGMVAFSVLIGAMRGFVREVLSSFSWVCAIGVCWLYTEQLSQSLEQYIESPPLRIVVTAIPLFVVTLLATGALVTVISKWVKSSILSGTDRLFGTLFGLLRGVAVVAILLGLARHFPVEKSQWWLDSIIVPYVEEAGRWIRQHFVNTVVPLFDRMTQVI